MKRLMVSALLLALGLVGAVGAQQGADNPYVVFARAGRVNYVAGSVTRQRSDNTVLGETLAQRDNLEAGDVVRTGAYGRMEVLLNPGSYLRANAGTEFSLLSTELDDLRLRLNKGSVLLEVMGPEDLKMGLSIETPHTLIGIVKRGIYRLDVNATGTNVIVQKGRALVGLNRTEVKGGKQLNIVGGTAMLAKFDKKLLDGFDSWSRERSATLAALNSRVTDESLRRALSATTFNSSLGRGHGLWFFDRFCRCYTFLPFGGNGWGSPYGWSYGWGLDYGNFLGWYPSGGGTIVTGGNGRDANGGRVGNVVLSPNSGGAETGERSPGPPAKNPNLIGERGGPPARDNGKPLLVERQTEGFFGGSVRDSGFGSDSGGFSSPSSRSSSDNSSKPTVSSPPPVSSPARAEVDSAGGGATKKPNRR